MYAWIFHGDAAWPHFADKESPFCAILLHSTDIFLPSIFFSGVSKEEEAADSQFPQRFSQAAFVLEAFI